MSVRKTLAIACLTIAASATTASADCRQIDNAGSYADGTWLYRKNGGWWPIGALTAEIANGRQRTMTFAYIARDAALRAARRGILIIKTGVEGPYATNTGRVALIRENYTRYHPSETCENYPNFPSNKSVRIRSYDFYHDYGEITDRADSKTLQNFHVSYLTQPRGCKRSDDANADPYQGRSNASDFSFNPEIVKSGQRSQFWAQFGFGTAYAEPLADRQVTIKRYIADAEGLACVTFESTLRPGGFIRINDLERRKGAFRTDEQSWTWPGSAKQ
ncbi:hypothetical protein RPB_3835 [Rhodopseudomonas palustris HaA2]|uniref:Uncharacterized protein n=1 Tax=Rhodopseudomonas palustris (strain HaA2) TaxID=316058 RepID=Q2ITD2_RHOP2|nr:hypothetical protein [Rhodopseudomonas palustris]ABD08528.1 hypothetical protein RPB_3835 [Rhodopseudomonas palustris HaA2]